METKLSTSITKNSLSKISHNIIFPKIQDFFTQRPKATLQHMAQYFGIKGELKELTITSNKEGKVKVNTIIPTLKSGSWTGQYYSDIPITLTVVDSDSFKGWSGDVESKETTIEVTLTSDMKIEANF